MSTNIPLILVPTSPGELIDKITVLNLKVERISDPARLANVKIELALLQETRDKYFPTDPDLLEKVSAIEVKLKKANGKIWDWSEQVREVIGKKQFWNKFVDLTLGIHQQNDTRASFKKEINLLLGSSIVEEKSYKDWK